MNHPITTPEAAFEAAALYLEKMDLSADLEAQGVSFCRDAPSRVFAVGVRALAARIQPVSPDVAGLVDLMRAVDTPLTSQAADTITRLDRELQAALARVNRLQVILADDARITIYRRSKAEAREIQNMLKGTSHE